MNFLITISEYYERRFPEINEEPKQYNRCNEYRECTKTSEYCAPVTFCRCRFVWKRFFPILSRFREMTSAFRVRNRQILQI